MVMQWYNSWCHEPDRKGYRMSDRKALLRAWAAWNDLVIDTYGTAEAVEAARKRDGLADRLGDFDDADWAVIRLAQREYARGAGSA